MAYTIGQVEELSGVKSHVLRYWEEVVPGFNPQKDISGRRLYSQRDLEIIFRLKYLITEQKFTAEGAGHQILRESQTVQNNPDIIQQIRQCRSELLKVLSLTIK
ncbi:MAG: MerR family transcriptional regulator [Treponema sp.]|nr:MerR family transcriptional regulator [Treponema sp.]